MATEPILVFTCQGFVWHIRAHAIAHHCAAYYDTEVGDTYRDTYTQMLSNADDLWDWYQGDMHWEEIPEADKRCVETHRLVTPTNVRNFLDEAENNPDAWKHHVIEGEWQT